MPHTTSILLTGSNGFIGNFLQENLKNNYIIYTLSHTNWKKEEESLQSCHIGFHLAGLSHKKNPSYEDYYQANVEFTKEFLRICKNKNVQHIIYFSSIKALGEGKKDPYNEFSIPQPEDNYGKTKLIAEKTIQEFCYKNQITYTILRPPLVYGPHPKGNIAKMIQWIQKGYPFLLPKEKTFRSFVSLYNINHLVQKILDLYCEKNKNIENQVFLIQDPYPIAVEDFYILLAEAMNKKPKIWHVPKIIDICLQRLPRIEKQWKKIASSLVIDDSYTRKKLNWSPPISTKEGITRMVKSL